MSNILKYQNPAEPLLESKDTLNTSYLAFKRTLPDNLRLTPEKDYHMYAYWKLSGKPKNFKEGKRRGMFTWDNSDKGYHAGSIAEDRNTGIYHFMKPKHHPTVKYELDWFTKGLKTLEGGEQVPVEGKDKKFWEDFTSKYQLDSTGVDYRYVPIQKNGGILKAQGGTGNLYAPHPLSPVGIALNQARAMAKMKGDQQYLPPGVKEVVGPDGKKVAIRTEQPLVPLEQSIAEWLPGTGDVAEVGYIANDVKNGNYGSAALAAAMVALPGNVGKIFRKSDIPTSKLTEAERLGIPKGERSNPKALDNPQYWGYEQWNERYNAAVRAGNWEEVQRLRDLHFIRNAPNTKIVDENGMPVHMYHGSGRRFTEFATSWADIDEFARIKGLFTRHDRTTEVPVKLKMLKTKKIRPEDDNLRSYFTPEYGTALGYTPPPRKDPRLVYDTYLNVENPYTYVNGFETDFDGDLKETVMKSGYDGVFIPSYAKSMVPLNSSAQIKFADLITWDGKGNIIPIVKRDNFRNIDIRYQKGGKL